MHVVRGPIEKIAREGGRTGRLRRMSDVFFTAAAVMLFGTAPAWAGDPNSLEVVGRWGGLVRSVFFDEANPDVAYVGVGRRLVVLNLADPEDIVEYASIDVEGSAVSGVVRGRYAYVAGGNSRFRVIDVADPFDPRVVWARDTSARQVELYGNAAYVRTRRNLEVYDITIPQSPVFRGWLMGDVKTIAVSGDLLYVVYQVNGEHEAVGVKIADLSVDPFSLDVIGEVTLPVLLDHEDGLAIDVEGSHAYVTVRTSTPSGGRLAVFDVSNPQAPFVAGSYDGGFDVPYDVAVRSGFAYVADSVGATNPLPHGALRIFDVATDPSSPTLIDSYETQGAITGVEIFGTRAYVRDEGEGLTILDISVPANPLRLGNWYSPAELRKMDKVGDLLYITDEWNGITILDVAEPSSPALVGVYQVGLNGVGHWGIEVRDGLAYLSAGSAGLQVVDVGDPTSPALAGSFPFNSGLAARAMELDGNIVHVGVKISGGGFMVNFDVSDLESIVDVGFVWMGSAPNTIETSPAGIACIARRRGGGGALTNVNTSDPNDPYVIYDGQPGGVDLARDGNLVYLANEARPPDPDGGLYILDVSDPSNSVQLSHFPTDPAYGVAVQNNFAYLTVGMAKLVVFDVSDPEAPHVVKEAGSVVSGAQAVLVDGRYAYVASIAGYGLAIVQLAEAIPGDLDDDGCVDLADLATLLAHYDTTSGMTYEDGDLDGDEDVDLADLAGLLAHYGEGCP